MCLCVCTLFPVAMESHGECEIKVQLNCSHCQTQSCKRDEDTHLILCLCDDDDEVLASDNVTCVSTIGMYNYTPIETLLFLLDDSHNVLTVHFNVKQ